MVWRALFVLTALLLTVSCGGGQKGATPPPPASTTAAAPSPQPSPSATPFVSNADEAGAFAFVREYISRLNAASADGNTGQLTVLRTETCSCIKAETNLRNI